MGSNLDCITPRFTLKHLLAATAVIAFFAAPISWLGGMYVTALILSCLMLGLVTRGLLKGKLIGPCLSCLLPFGACFMMFISAAATLQALLTVLVIALTVPFADRGWARVYACLLVMMLVYGGFAMHGVTTIRELEALTRVYPFESVADRLPSFATTEPVKLSESAQQHLQEFEWRVGSGGWGSRSRSLRSLHNRAARQFYAAQGFGVTRMMLMRPEALAAPPILRESPRLHGHSGEFDEKHLAHANRDLAVAFFSADDSGYVEDVEAVAGFLPHALRRQPADRSDNPDRVTWRVERLQLVSLLQHAAPVAYDLEGVLSMEQLASTPTRPLNAFELAALSPLAAEQDVVFEEQEGGVQMVGAIRAAESCLACHDVQRGQLLGAFSYHLVAAATEPSDDP